MSEAARFLAHLSTALSKAGVPYMLAGSFASSVHGAPRAYIEPWLDALDVRALWDRVVA